MINKKLTITLISLSILSVLISNHLIQIEDKKNTTEQKVKNIISSIDLDARVVDQQDLVVTIFVHGTVLPVPSFAAVKDLFKKDEEKTGSAYQRYLDHLRDNLYAICQPGLGLGLHELDLNDSKIDKDSVTYLFTNAYNNVYQKANCENRDQIHKFYFFGWNGRLDHDKRLKAANELYNSIIELKKKLQQKYSNKNFCLELVGHSHGGNVLLNLARSEVNFKKNLKIDKLILLGSPNQTETHNCINSDIFKKIYNFYSNSDFLQVADIISTKDFYSKRKFNKNNSQAKLFQIKLKAGKLEPRHTELWLWGKKAPYIFRKNVSYYPYPVVTFVPLIINHLENNLKDDSNIIVNIKKDEVKSEFKFDFTRVQTDVDGKRLDLLQQSNVSCALVDIEELKNQVKQKIPQ